MVVIIYYYIGYKYKATTFGSPMVLLVTLGQQYNVGEKPTVILLYTYTNHHAGPPIITVPPDWGMLRRSRCVLIFL